VIRSANHSSYPLEADDPTVEQLREAGEAERAALHDELAAIAVAEQSRAFVDVVTDGMTRWSGPLSHVASALDGFDLGDTVDWPGTAVVDRRPVVTGPVRHRRPFLVDDLRAALEVAQKPVKVVLPGPVTFARLADDRVGAGLAALAGDVAAALAVEVAALARAGGRHFQLDEPLLGRHAGDLELVAATARRVFAGAGPGALTLISTWGGDLGAIGGRGLAALPCTHLGVDLTAGEGNQAVLADLPAGMGVYLGLFDAGRPDAEDAAEVARRIAPLRERLSGRDLMVGPQHGLAGLGRDEAFDKLLQARYLSELLQRDSAWSASERSA